MKDLNPFSKVEITFSPAWWTAKYGMDFGSAAYWHDPIHYTERDREQRRLLFERFGEVGLGEADPQPDPQVGVEYGHRFMSAFWGCEVIYPSAEWPHAQVLPDTAERIARLAIPDVDDSPAVKLAFANAKILEDRYGKVRSAVNFGGPLNNAVSVLGEEIFAVCASDPELAEKVLRQMGEAVFRVHDLVECKINKIPRGKERQKNWGIGNCPVGQISPEMYRQVVLPVDLWFRNSFQGGFSLHHCGIFHPYVDVYQPLKPSDIDAGPGTDLRLTRRAYPDTPISAYFNPATFSSLDRQTIDAIYENMVQEAHPANLLTYIRAIEVGPELTDDSVRDMMTARERYALDHLG
jgi:hypothetical protein